MNTEIQHLKPTERILSLKERTLTATRYLSTEQARLITLAYQENENLPVILKRAKALAKSLLNIHISIDPEELIVGNRTPGIRAGVVFPEAGISWLDKEIETLPNRLQDPFQVKKDDISFFEESLARYWKGKTMENDIYDTYGEELKAIEKVVKINQKDHAQGHICPNVEDWLTCGPAGLLEKARLKKENTSGSKKDFYESVCITLEASCGFIRRYGKLASEMAAQQTGPELKANLNEIAATCNALSENPPGTYRQAIQSVWFLFVILQMESNASSFSPGRIDQYLYPYFDRDLKNGTIDLNEALELMDALFIKFNQIVYMRNAHSAKYFAGFPIGFNCTIGGQTADGKDATNELSMLILKAQDHIRLPQPNLTARIHKNSPHKFLDECSRIIGLGTGMPQIANDESIIPSLREVGISDDDSMDYVLVGCVELSTQGNYLGWSDAAMFNLVKVLELTLNNGKCLLSGKQMGLQTGYLTDYNNFNELENAFQTQIDYFIDKMILACEVVEKSHQEHLPSPFLSSVIDNCIENGLDVTSGGAKYNLSGIQAIQVANIADSLAVLQKLVFEEKKVEKETLLNALQANYKGNEQLRQLCINHVPKYGNDVAWVDELGAKWAEYFAKRIKLFKNYRGGRYHMGLYTVSAHVPMGANVGASADGRLAETPLADGGMSPMYGRDKTGPTAVLNSVLRVPSLLASNGTLLNMKFLPSVFKSEQDRSKFTSMLKSFAYLPIHHVQFNVVTTEELEKAKADPESYRGLTIRVAGYTAYFTELAFDLQDEIINRTTYGEA
ncbi:MAG: formate C-acetyltransferase/glycerol dehydratase family glycyl radical enzyme [Draconibacterium sp.]